MHRNPREFLRLELLFLIPLLARKAELEFLSYLCSGRHDPLVNMLDGSKAKLIYLLTSANRDILQFDNTVDDAINRMINERRTCNLIIGNTPYM